MNNIQLQQARIRALLTYELTYVLPIVLKDQNRLLDWLRIRHAALK